MGSPSSMSTTARDSRVRFLIVTLGCAKNEVDSDRMRSLLVASGYSEATSPEDADVALINTCSFLASATSESIEATLELADDAKAGVRELPIIMCGCVPSRYGAELEEELPEVAAFVRTDEEDGIVEVVDSVLGIIRQDVPGRPEVLRTIEATSAYLKISDGCDRFCTFCAIPNIRGRYHSRPLDELVAEAEGLVAGGVRELVLIGQDTGVWGCDLPGEPTLASLLRAMAEVVRPVGGWVRVLYLQPEGMTDELVDVLASVDEVLPYIDIPIQHVSERILRDMGRSGSPEELEGLFARLRERIPGLVLRTTAMAGFPGETEADFEELAEFLPRVGFDYCSVFAYSAEEGTAAAAMRDQVDEDVKLERTQELLDIAEQMGFAATAAHVGERTKVIIDGVEEGPDGVELIGHAWFQAPDSDGAVHISDGDVAVGDVVTCDIIDAFCYELEATIAEDGA